MRHSYCKCARCSFQPFSSREHIILTVMSSRDHIVDVDPTLQCKIEFNWGVGYCFDVCEFYPSVTEKLRSTVLDFALITAKSPTTNVRSSCMQKDHCCSATIVRGRKKPKQSIWCHHGIFRWSWNMWIVWILPFVPPQKEVWPKHWLIPGRRTGSLQHETMWNGKIKKEVWFYSSWEMK